MQRTSIEAAAALMSIGNSRNTKRTLPVSIYFDLSIGNTFSWNAAQCGQLIDAYSTMVTAALALPSAMSGSDTGFATSAAAAFCANASPISGCGAWQARAASPASDRATARAWRKAIKGLLRKAATSHTLKYLGCASLKRPFWQWAVAGQPDFPAMRETRGRRF